MKLVTATLVALVLVSGAVATPALAGTSFIARPTEPLACPSGPVAGGLWEGYFHGRKELDWGYEHYQDTAERYCFRSEKLCKNWLYNMQSEYDYMIWSAVCRRIAG